MNSERVYIKFLFIWLPDI